METAEEKLNTDNEYYYRKGKKLNCKICEKELNSEDLVNHYVQEHPKFEVFCSRLSEKWAKFIKSDERKLTEISEKYLEIFCCFCDIYHIRTDWNLEDLLCHFSEKTGEYLFYCTKCGEKMPEKGCHCRVANETSTRLAELLENDKIFAFICERCNYIQLDESNIVKHLRSQHGLTGELTEDFKKILLAQGKNLIFFTRICT